METTTAAVMRFRLQSCERCGRETIHALQGDPLGQALPDRPHICSGCEPALFERLAFEAGRKELLR